VRGESDTMSAGIEGPPHPLIVIKNKETNNIAILFIFRPQHTCSSNILPLANLIHDFCIRDSPIFSVNQYKYMKTHLVSIARAWTRSAGHHFKKHNRDAN
jgi:hypothetical protein